MQRSGYLRRVETKCPCAILIDLQRDVLYSLVPFQLRIDGARICPHNREDAVRNLAHLLRIFADNAELYREANGGAKIQPVNADACFRHRTIRDSHFKPFLKPLARARILGHDHGKGEVGVRQHRVQRQEKSGRTLPDIGRVHDGIRVGRNKLLGRGRGLRCCFDRSTLGHPHFHEKFRASGCRKELLLHQRHPSDGGSKGQSSGRDHMPATLE